MKEVGLRAIPTQKFLITADSNHAHKIYPNLVNRQFDVSLPDRALWIRQPSEKLIRHSDRGSRYCSNIYIDLLKGKQVEISMSRKGVPYGNACIKFFNVTIKKELIYGHRFDSSTKRSAVGIEEK